MPEYEAKSIEELRLEDSMAGNKGSMGQPGTATTQFYFGGSPALALGVSGPPDSNQQCLGSTSGSPKRSVAPLLQR